MKPRQQRARLMSESALQRPRLIQTVGLRGEGVSGGLDGFEGMRERGGGGRRGGERRGRDECTCDGGEEDGDEAEEDVA